MAPDSYRTVPHTLTYVRHIYCLPSDHFQIMQRKARSSPLCLRFCAEICHLRRANYAQVESIPWSTDYICPNTAPRWSKIQKFQNRDRSCAEESPWLSTPLFRFAQRFVLINWKKHRVGGVKKISLAFYHQWIKDIYIKLIKFCNKQ